MIPVAPFLPAYISGMSAAMGLAVTVTAHKASGEPLLFAPPAAIRTPAPRSKR